MIWLLRSCHLALTLSLAALALAGLPKLPFVKRR